MNVSDQLVLEERARQLAVPLADSLTHNTVDVVVFEIGAEKYMIESSYVIEIAKLTEYTPVPGTPNFVVGITNIRGMVMALIDLPKFFTLPARGLTDLTRIIVLGEKQIEFGILAQKADQSFALNKSEILEVSDSIAAGTKKYLKGVTAEAVLFLDGQALLADERLFIE